jgi:hypothetical protein
VSRTTYERLKAFCEANNVSMSQFVETRVGDFLNDGGAPPPAPRPLAVSVPMPPRPIASAPVAPRSESPRSFAPPVVPMTSAAARFAVEPPPPIIKPRPERSDQSAPKPAEKRPDQIFTF